MPCRQDFAANGMLLIAPNQGSTWVLRGKSRQRALCPWLQDILCSKADCWLRAYCRPQSDFPKSSGAAHHHTEYILALEGFKHFICTMPHHYIANHTLC